MDFLLFVLIAGVAMYAFGQLLIAAFVISVARGFRKAGEGHKIFIEAG